MKRISSLLAFCVFLTFTSSASATIIFDIYGVVDGLGLVEYSPDDVTDDFSDVLESDSASGNENPGAVNEDSVVDEVNGSLCVGDWDTPLSSVNASYDCDKQTDKVALGPYDPKPDSNSDQDSSWTDKMDNPDSVPNGVDLDHEQSVPEPGTIALLGLGLAGLGFARLKKLG